MSAENFCCIVTDQQLGIVVIGVNHLFAQHQTQNFVWQLARRLSWDDEDKIAGPILDAKIDLNTRRIVPVCKRASQEPAQDNVFGVDNE